MSRVASSSTSIVLSRACKSAMGTITMRLDED